MSDGDVIITEDISEVEKDNEILNASSLRVNKRLSVSKKRLITVPDVSDKEVVSNEILEAGEHSFLQLKYCSEIRENIGTILPKFESLFPILHR